MEEFAKEFEHMENVKFGVLLIGAPGTGKSTLCKELDSFMTDNLNRPHCLVNLDPANESVGYKPDIDIRDLITLEDVMEEYKLGPNGSMLYCIEFLLTNYQWLADQIDKYFIKHKCQYFVFDLPGQVEIYSNHFALKEIIKKLEQNAQVNFCAVHLVDVSYVYDKYRFLSAMTLSLTTLIGLEMPFINFVSKVDLLKEMGKPDMPLTFYQGTTYGLKYLFFSEYETADEQQKGFKHRFASLTKNLCEMLESYSQVAFTLLDITDKMSMTYALMKIDKANNYFMQPQRMENEKENSIDYEAVEEYFNSSEAIMDLEEKYFGEQD